MTSRLHPVKQELDEKLKGRTFLRVDEVADIFAASRRTVYDWIASGEINACRIGKALRVPKSEVMRLVEFGAE